jgi:hypothetical protein
MFNIYSVRRSMKLRHKLSKRVKFFFLFFSKFWFLNRSNRNAKHRLEHDWSNKFEADRADSKALSRKNTDCDIMYYPGSARYQEK